ncbi:hypothetical protein [Wenxinia saemankumensis]|uniref:TVP38/TMEM64 family membrane protein n=1 Tax=Wenxinia saemankumensis TaxID=1447782 RepID=A0A1M6HCH0_9RHOB|nr:hypothetical protein [Wenxinia saemankumensis]SHJ19958.1 hypothetical protein SAMN05444417_3159 [Wenxinia saemankumensis]
MTRPLSFLPRPVRLALRLALVAALVWALLALSDRAMALVMRFETGEARMLSAAIFAAYALLLAIPFVPAVEIGISILVMRGADYAPFVWGATGAGLMIAWAAGRFVPLTFLVRLARDLRLVRIEALLMRLRDMNPPARAAALSAALPRPVAALLTDWRYLTLALLLNLPGTIVLGGGGGLMLLAGMSGLFRGPLVLATVLLATLPVPLAVWLLGTGVLA